VKFNRLIIPALCIAGFFARCATIPVAGGSDNPDFKIAGVIIDANGNPSPHTEVRLIPGLYNPAVDPALSPSMTDTTDTLGVYRVAASKAGDYNIQAVHLIKRDRALIVGVSITADTTHVYSAALTAPGTIKVMLPPGGDTLHDYVYIPGTTFKTYIRQSGDSAFLDSVPAAIIPALYYCRRQAAAYAFRYDISVHSGDTAITAQGPWSYSKIFHLNTTGTGANVSGDACGFPALIRLTKDNFNFSQARLEGGDIRFTKADNTPLAYEIERWDPAAQSADIWVKIDTVFGNDESHGIAMYWGASAPAAGGESNGAAVFDTGNGFVGVWHLNDPGASVKDATYNAYGGSAYNMAPQSGMFGIIGAGREFRGDSSYITMPGTSASKLNFGQNDVYSLSAWIYTDTLDSLYQAIISKGDEQYNLEILGGDWEFAEYENKAGWNMSQSPSPATVRQWVHVVGVRNGAKQYLYVNGSCVDSVGKVLGNGFSRASGYDLMIGKTNGVSMPGFPYYFHGVLDEIRIHNCALSADWIKLCYMNQKMFEALIQW
jgi:hypothetical protein